MRRRKLPAAIASIGAVLLVGAPVSAAQRIALPTEADIVAIAPGEETILFGNKGIETLLPGPVDDTEKVHVGVAPDGTPVTVGVRQRLVVHGLGDFRFKVSGPAQDVEALPSSESEPGLRKGAVLWQGFSAGTKVLASTMNMFPEEEARRLPLRVAAEATIDGVPAPEGGSGKLLMRISVTNVSGGPVTITSAEGDPAELARALDAVAAELAHGRRPVPGANGVPRALTAQRGVRGASVSIGAPFMIRGRVSFPKGTLAGGEAAGGELTHGPAGPSISFGGLVGGGEPDELSVVVRGDATDLGRPVLDVVARPAPPSVAEARPPGGGTWAAALGNGASVDSRAMWDRLMTLSWEVAKLRQYDTYLGNPDTTGPGASVYRFTLAPPEEPPDEGVSTTLPLETTRLLAITAVLALLFLAFDGVLLWSLL
jgi:hypothetical protein